MADAKENSLSAWQMKVLMILQKQTPKETPVIWVHGMHSRVAKSAFIKWLIENKLAFMDKGLNSTAAMRIRPEATVIVDGRMFDKGYIFGLKSKFDKHVLAFSSLKSLCDDVILISADEE